MDEPVDSTVQELHICCTLFPFPERHYEVDSLFPALHYDIRQHLKSVYTAEIEEKAVESSIDGVDISFDKSFLQVTPYSPDEQVKGFQVKSIQPLYTKILANLVDCPIYDLDYHVTHYKKQRIQEIWQQIEREDLQHKHEIKRMQSLLARAKAACILQSSAKMDTDHKDMMVMAHQVIETSTKGGFMDQQRKIDAVKQQIEIEALQHKQIIKKMQSLLESVEISFN